MSVGKPSEVPRSEQRRSIQRAQRVCCCLDRKSDERAVRPVHARRVRDPEFFLPQVTEPTLTQLGWPTKFTVLIGVIELVGTLLYVLLFSVYLGLFMWGGLWLRSANLRALFPLTGR
jgi:hypothetical protein